MEEMKHLSDLSEFYTELIEICAKFYQSGVYSNLNYAQFTHLWVGSGWTKNWVILNVRLEILERRHSQMT